MKKLNTVNNRRNIENLALHNQTSLDSQATRTYFHIITNRVFQPILHRLYIPTTISHPLTIKQFLATSKTETIDIKTVLSPSLLLPSGSREEEDRKGTRERERETQEPTSIRVCPIVCVSLYIRVARVGRSERDGGSLIERKASGPTKRADNNR